MKKISVLLLTTALVLGLLAGCGAKKEAEPAKPETATTQTDNKETTVAEKGTYADGTYFAQEKEFDKSGWKYVVTMQVKDGKISSVDWNGVSKASGPDKKTLSKEGKYGMKEKGKALGEWHEEAEKAEQYLIEKQDPKAIEVKEDGSTDAISGVTIHVNALVSLAEEALAAGPVQTGPYKDGAYHAEQDKFADSGWKDTVDLTIMNGNIVAVNWDGVNKAGGDVKKKVSEDGKYGMKANGNSQAEWHEEAAKAEQFLLEKQDPKAFAVKDDGSTDAVSGVTIHVNGFTELVEKALEGAK